MVLMRMTDQDGRRAAPVERFWQEACGAFRRVKRPPGVEDNAVPGRMCNLDTASTNLSRATMDRQFQAHADKRMALASLRG
jgi:hypothetical protein